MFDKRFYAHGKTVQRKQIASGARREKKAKIDAGKAAIRAEDMAKGIYIPVGKLPRQEPQRVAQASAAV